VVLSGDETEFRCPSGRAGDDDEPLGVDIVVVLVAEDIAADTGDEEVGADVGDREIGAGGFRFT
jgi:hypothetical protein